MEHSDLRSNHKVIKEDLLRHPNILGASFLNYTPINISNVSDAQIEGEGDSGICL